MATTHWYGHAAMEDGDHDPAGQPAVGHLELARGFFASHPTPDPYYVLVRWAPPLPGCWKLNFDGSVLFDGSMRASIGGAIRDWNGWVVLAFADRTEHAPVGEVEARALLRGLRLALQHGYSYLVAEGDDLTLVQLLRGESRRTRIPRAMEEEIIEALDRFESVEVLHVYREGNQVAHALCQHAYKPQQQEVPTAFGIPVAVWKKAEDDRKGVAYTRVLAGVKN